MSKKFYLHILSRNGQQITCTSDEENEKKLNRLTTEGWLLQDTKEFTDIKLAYKTKAQIEWTLDRGGREVV
jgi:hypothetical protein